MKKFIAILLSVALIVPMVLVPTFANTADEATPVTAADSMESAFAEGTNSLVVFVTGIGQSFSYLFDESYTQEGAFEKGTLQDYENYAPLIAEGKYLSRWNLFNSFDEVFSNTDTIMTIVGVVFADKLLGLMDTPDEVINLSTLYLRIYFAGMVAMMIYNRS